MTMPQYHNCPHDDDGWCLRCVQKLADELHRANIIISNTTSEFIKAQAEVLALQQMKPYQGTLRARLTDGMVCVSLPLSEGDDPNGIVDIWWERRGTP
jgi:hypothetical protein